MEFAWDPDKARINVRKHGVDFTDIATVFRDERSLTIVDEDPDQVALLSVKTHRPRPPRPPASAEAAASL